MRECHLARSYALQPVHPQTLGLGFQMVGQTNRTVKTAAELRNRLQPRLGRNLEPIASGKRDTNGKRDGSDIAKWSVSQITSW